MSETNKFEEQMLKMKFHSLVYTAPKRLQKMSEVTDDGRGKQKNRSYECWKRVNPGFFDGAPETTSRSMQQYEERDFIPQNKERFRIKDRHTEYVEYVVRDHALARKSGK